MTLTTSVVAVAWAEAPPEQASGSLQAPAASKDVKQDVEQDPKQARRAAHPAVEKMRALREQVGAQERLLREQMRGADAKTRKVLREQMDAAREQMQAARQEMTKIRREALDRVGAAVEEARNDWRATHGELMDAMRNRAQRVRESVEARHERVERARKRAWDKTRRVFEHVSDIPDALTKELRMHGQRTARLLRIRAIAENEGDRATVTRTDELMEREEKRHHAAVGPLLTPRGIRQRRAVPTAAQAQAPDAPAVEPAAVPAAQEAP